MCTPICVGINLFMALGDAGGVFSVCLHLGHHSVTKKVKQKLENTFRQTVLLLASGLPKELVFKPSMEFSYRNSHCHVPRYNPPFVCSFLSLEGLGVLRHPSLN